MDKRYPRLGTAVWVKRDGKFLLGVRDGAWGPDTWCPPGGHLDFNETVLECAIRETKEESGIEIENVRFMTFLDTIWKEKDSHTVTMYFTADWKSGEPVPQMGEIKRWEWFDWNSLPRPLFYPLQLFVDAGLNPLECKS